jgi:hypothetical protein
MDFQDTRKVDWKTWAMILKQINYNMNLCGTDTGDQIKFQIMYQYNKVHKMFLNFMAWSFWTPTFLHKIVN